jgi:hypothetical protein
MTWMLWGAGAMTAVSAAALFFAGRETRDITAADLWAAARRKERES